MNVNDYLYEVSEEKKEAFLNLRETILTNIPSGFEEQISYGMIGFVVPHGLYPSGYHCNPKLPLPFISIAAQKKFIALYHLGLYSNSELTNWFTVEYPKYSSAKLDMGKSCIRFNKWNEIPLELIAQLAQKLSVGDWIKYYEAEIKK